MGVEAHIVDFAPILMARQIDQGGHEAMISSFEQMGLKVHCCAHAAAFIGQDESTTDDDMPSPVTALKFSNENPSWEALSILYFVLLLPTSSQGINLQRNAVIIEVEVELS
jgi:nitrite reductase (NADH) large subunit